MRVGLCNSISIVTPSLFPINSRGPSFCTFLPDDVENVCSGDSGWHKILKDPFDCLLLSLGGPFVVAGGDGVTPGQNYEQLGVVSQTFGDCDGGNIYAK